MRINPAAQLLEKDRQFLIGIPDQKIIGVSKIVFEFFDKYRLIGDFSEEDIVQHLTKNHINSSEGVAFFRRLVEKGFILQDGAKRNKVEFRFARLTLNIFPLIGYHSLARSLHYLAKLYISFNILFPVVLLINAFLYLRFANATYSISFVDFLLLISLSLFHELGHLAALRYFRINGGSIGVSIFGIFPMFFCNLSSIYFLDERLRYKVNLGGTYFHAIGILFMFLLYFITDLSVFLQVALMSFYILAINTLALPGFDGYFFIKDLYPHAIKTASVLSFGMMLLILIMPFWGIYASRQASWSILINVFIIAVFCYNYISRSRSENG